MKEKKLKKVEMFTDGAHRRDRGIRGSQAALRVSEMENEI
jgi:ribonuclease HI